MVIIRRLLTLGSLAKRILPAPLGSRLVTRAGAGLTDTNGNRLIG